ncbi:unnamed protein product [Prorocentrum cordatum]|uniref:Uncharacterized protein n=1 Tax=Prorocentrum cordatum TaxID=2364126 RepID=A0ABN9V4C6_9DINO|nr:unnamed protein product [Polarella glacialis]
MYLVCGGMVVQLLVVFIFAQATRPPAKPAETALANAAAGAPETPRADTPRADTPRTEGAGDSEDPAEGDAFDKVAGEQNDAHPVLGRAKYVEGMEHVASTVWTLQLVSMLCIYCGVAGVIVGVYLYPVGTTKVSAAVLCTIVQSGAYCLSFFFLWAARSLCRDVCDGFQHGLVNAGLAMCSTMRKAPMFSVLFLAARMRALNLDPPHGLPPFWLQCCFYSTTALLILEALLSAVVGLTGTPKKAYYGVAIFESKLKGVQILMHMCALMTYLMLFAIFYGVFAMVDQRPRIGDDPNPEYEHRGTLSTTVHCVLLYEVAYFSVQAGQSVTMLLQDLRGASLPSTLDTFVSAGISLGLAPMFCVLFVATRMRALQITEQMGAPPGWAQDSMYICLFATCLQATCCLVMPIFVGSACKVDEDGNPDYDLQPMVGAYAVTVVKYVAMLSLYGGLILVISSIFLMDRQSCMGWRDNRFITSYRELFEALLVVALLFFVALLFSSAKVIGMAVKLAIEAADEAVLGVNIEIQNAALNLCRGYVKVEKLKVCQPEFETIWSRDEKGAVTGTRVQPEVRLTWKEDYIFKVKTLLIKVNLWRLITSLGKEFELQNLTLTGIKVNFEKPTADMKQSNSNVEYVINFIDSLGLLPPLEETAPSPPPPPPADPAEAGQSWWAKMKAELDAVPRVLLEKIEVGDIGATVLVQNVRWLGGRDIRFAPSIGTVRFENIQRDVFGGREDLKPQEIIACVVKALGKKLCTSIVSEIPNMIAQRAKEGAGQLLRSVSSRFGASPGGLEAQEVTSCPRRSPRP